MIITLFLVGTFLSVKIEIEKGELMIDGYELKELSCGKKVLVRERTFSRTEKG